MAKSPELSSELIKQMAAEVSEGTPICYVCDLFGVIEATYHNWMKQGQDDYNNGIETLQAELFFEIKKSCATHIVEARKIIKSGKPGWQGTAWWLERTNNMFMPKQQITPDEDGKVIVQIGGKVKDVIKK